MGLNGCKAVRTIKQIGLAAMPPEQKVGGSNQFRALTDWWSVCGDITVFIPLGPHSFAGEEGQG